MTNTMVTEKMVEAGARALREAELPKGATTPLSIFEGPARACISAALEQEQEAVGCEVCGYDCAGANPPVVNCPMRNAAATRELIGDLTRHADAPVHHWEDWQNKADTLMREAAEALRAALASPVATREDVVRHVAILERHDRRGKKAVIVPDGQSLDFDEDGATRRWLHPYLGNEYHLDEFLPLQCAADALSTLLEGGR